MGGCFEHGMPSLARSNKRGFSRVHRGFRIAGSDLDHRATVADLRAKRRRAIALRDID